eukprot:TRINITY_DN9327_c0_g1_i9.p1 TRINITY_DN9327_c0_g1~~TRINITY_DN9327_c0_g1_i9.p1  ORF type:complete len:560 (-),score=93.02 TRINITY_DN9327_c0_g1_i9:582-2261(-)
MASPSPKPLISTSEKKDLDKFTKNLSIKVVQTVVQSRLGEKVCALSQPDTQGGTSWYNLAIKDIHEVLSETKKALSGQLPSPGKPLVVEISLKTAEGDSMVLEWWRLAVVAGGDPQVKITHSVYNRMGILLKSLITVTRVTPAYRLSRSQGQDNYVICYRIFLGDPPDPPDLGEGALTARVGQVTTPVSTIVCCVDYRTSMTMPPRQSSRPILVKSDHFDSKEEISLRFYKREYRTSESSEQGITSDDSQEMRVFATSPPEKTTRIISDEEGTERMRFGAFARTDSLPCLEEELQEPLLNLLPRPRPDSAVSVTSGGTSGTDSHTDTQFLMSSDSGKLAERGLEPPALSAGRGESRGGRGRTHSLGNKSQSGATTTTVQSPGFPGGNSGLFVGAHGVGLERRSSSGHLERTDSEKRLSSGGMIPETGGGGHGAGMASSSAQGQRAGPGQMTAAAPHRTSLFGGATGTDMDRDFVMIDLKTPFATQASSVEGSSAGADNTLGSFFKDVSAAPNLMSLPPSGLPLRDTMSSWTTELNRFESDLQQYDDLLDECGSASDIDS